MIGKSVFLGTVILGSLTLAVRPRAPGGEGGRGAEIYVAAASSLTDALEHLSRDFQRSHGTTVRLDVSSSGILRKKIEAGCGADVFLSASVKDMDVLQEGGLVEAAKRMSLLRNSLVCVVPSSSNLSIASPSDLLKGCVRNVAIGDPDYVPAGDYAKQALMNANLWRGLAGKLVPCANARAVLAQAEAGTVEAAIVFSSDAKVSRKVRVAFDLPTAAHTPIVYQAAVLKGASNPRAARDFLAFVARKSTAHVFSSYGFEPIPRQVE